MAACILGSPANLEAVIADMAAVMARLPRMRSVIQPGLGWYFRREKTPPCSAQLARHFTVIADEAIRGTNDLEKILSKSMSLPFASDLPPWRVYLINSVRQSDEPRKSSALYAAIIHFDHSIADGFRMDRMVRNMSAKAGENHSHLAREVADLLTPMDMAEYAALPEMPEIPRQEIALFEAGVTAKGRKCGHFRPMDFVNVFARALGSQGVFNTNSKRRCTALEVMSDGTNRTAEEGNFIRFRALDAIPPGQSVNFTRSLAYRLIRPTGPWGFGFGALFPRPVLRGLLRFWYRQFDMLISYIPGARKPFMVGGARVKAIYALSPRLADLPVLVTVYSGLGRTFTAVQTGTAIQCSVRQLADTAARDLSAPAGRERQAAKTREVNLEEKCNA